MPAPRPERPPGSRRGQPAGWRGVGASGVLGAALLAAALLAAALLPPAGAQVPPLPPPLPPLTVPTTTTTSSTTTTVAPAAPVTTAPPASTPSGAAGEPPAPTPPASPVGDPAVAAGGPMKPVAPAEMAPPAPPSAAPGGPSRPRLGLTTLRAAVVAASYSFGAGGTLLATLLLVALVSLSRTGGSSVPDHRRTRLALGIVCLALAAAVGLVGYLKLSLEPEVNRQIPYLASAGMALVLLAVTGGSLLVAEQLRSDDRRIEELEAAVRSLAGALAPAVEAPARRSGGGAPDSPETGFGS